MLSMFIFYFLNFRRGSLFSVSLHSTRAINEVMRGIRKQLSIFRGVLHLVVENENSLILLDTSTFKVTCVWSHGPTFCFCCHVGVHWRSIGLLGVTVGKSNASRIGGIVKIVNVLCSTY